MLPEEDRGPAWLRDYTYTDFGAIEADIAAMEQYAAKLAADLTSNYVPHLSGVTDAMLTELPAPSATFPELVSFMTDHQATQDVVQQNIYNFANGTNHFAAAAQSIGQKYSDSDAFAHATVTDVNRAFDSVQVPPSGTGPGPGAATEIDPAGRDA